jgi:hypothetical protein
LQAEIDRAKAEAAKKPKEEQAKMLATIRQQENVLKTASQYYLSGSGATNMTAPIAPGARVAASASRVASVVSSAATQSTVNQATSARPATATTPMSGDITVHVTGYCIRCKNEIDGGQQAASLNPAGTNI